MTDKPKNKNRKKSLVVLSIVKVLLVIVLTIACNINFIKFDVWYNTSGVRNNMIYIEHPNDEIVIKYIVRNGDVYSSSEILKEIEVKPKQIVSWVKPSKTFNSDYITILGLENEKVVWIAIIKVVVRRAYKSEYFPIILQQGYLIIPREESEARNLIDQYIEQKEKTRISLWDRNLKE